MPSIVRAAQQLEDGGAGEAGDSNALGDDGPLGDGGGREGTAGGGRGRRRAGRRDALTKLREDALKGGGGGSREGGGGLARVSASAVAVPDKYDFDPQDDLIDQLNLEIGQISREHIPSCAKQVVHSARLSYKAEEYSMVVILRMNRAFMEYMRKHEKDYEPGK